MLYIATIGSLKIVSLCIYIPVCISIMSQNHFLQHVQLHLVIKHNIASIDSNACMAACMD